LVKKEHTPVILLGDLNATPDSKTISNLNRYFKDANLPDDFTYPADDPEKKIDYILVDKRHFIKTLNGGVYKVNYSDHRPIFAEIKLSL
jgi:endonuclease/exonuclease/phosphatase family metal-dependent hydrolase